MRKANRSWHNLIILQNASNNEMYFWFPPAWELLDKERPQPQSAFLCGKLLTSPGTTRFYTKKGEQNGTVAQYVWRKKSPWCTATL
jgi:hypothetical protein